MRRMSKWKMRRRSVQNEESEGYENVEDCLAGPDYLDDEWV